ncbi:MAG: copper resistance protein CopC, partial [Acidimicrobiia bacterium]|nr:copper resistance protein CopC [Acidimicrobiia bacterium]
MPNRARLCAGLIAVIAVVAVLWPATAAFAHALRISSVPDNGAVLKTSPSEVTVTFSEVPDPSLSSIRVLDSSGSAHQQGKAAPVPGQPATLHVPIGHLSNGVYTVTWQTVSHVDGHLASGSFAFGVGVSPA